MDKITGNSWTLLSIFNQSTTNSIATSKSFVHTAKLLENKYRKYTHVMFNGEPIPGSVLDYTYDYCFMNFVNIPGESFKFTGETGKQTAKVKGSFISVRKFRT